MHKIEMRNCDECAHAAYKFTVYPPVDGCELSCTKGHKPSFYKPRRLADGYLEFDWGYKRRCEDFEPVGDMVPP